MPLNNVRKWYQVAGIVLVTGGFLWTAAALSQSPQTDQQWLFQNQPPVAGSGNCLSFNGSNQYVDIGDARLIDDNLLTWTIEFWIKPNNPFDSSRIFHQGKGSSRNFQVAALWKKNQVEFAYGRDGETASDTATSCIASDVWTHVALSYDNRTPSVYVNGIPSGGTFDHTKRSRMSGNTYIGSSDRSNYFKGCIDELRVWKTVRTQAQILSTMYGYPVGSDTANLIGYWRFDASCGAALKDFACTPHNSTCANMTDANWVASEAWRYRATRGASPICHGAGYDPERAVITVTQFLAPLKGVLSINGTNLTYTPNANCGGVDSYVFQVSDGSLTDTFRVTVTDTNAPYILTQPAKNQTVSENQQVTFSVKATGFPFPAFQWQKLKGSAWVNINSATTGDSSYSIAGAKDTNAGTYRVVVANSLGAVTSDTACLAVQAVQTAPTITIQPQKSQVLAEAALFRVWVAANGKPRPVYLWQRLAGQAWNNILGATDSVFKIDALKISDSGVYRAAVSNIVGTVYSDSAKLIIQTIPVITSVLPFDTVLLAGTRLSFTAAAAGIPAPGYEWFFKRTPSDAPQSIATTATMTIDTLKKVHHGYYFAIARNSAGTDTSNIVFVHVLEPVKISNDLPQQYGVPLNGTATLRIQVTGDDYISFRWYANDTLLPGDTQNTLTINNVTNEMSGKAYYCMVSNSYMNTLLGRDTSRICTLRISQYYNPFLANVRKVDLKNVVVNFWSNDPFIKKFPTCKDSLIAKPWSDSLWLMYRKNEFVTDPDKEGSVVLVPTAKIKATYPDTTRIVVSVDSLLFPDSVYCFNYTLKWHSSSNLDTVFHPFYEAAKLLMLDTTVSNNPLAARGVYIPRTDSALLIIDSIQRLNGAVDSFVTVQCSTDPAFVNQSAMMFNRNLPAKDLLALQKKSDTLVIHNLGLQPLETDTVFCRWSVTSRSLVKSMEKKSEFLIGWPRPVYNGILKVDSTTTSTQMAVQWNMQDTAADSVRVWFDLTRSLKTGDLNIPLPLSQALYPPPNAVRDTVERLSPNTKYFFWIQIYRDRMWSRICANGSDSGFTAHADTQQVDNIIAIDSSWFNDTSNRIMIQWSIDTTKLPPQKEYECGYTFSLDTSGFLKEKQTWHRAHHGKNTTAVEPGKNILFDTNYTVGLWLRGKNPNNGKITNPSLPTEKSRCRVRIPAFAWQVVTLRSAFDPDTAYAANGSIVLRSLTGNPFDFSDTVRAYLKDTMPAGFMKVGGVPFRFTKKDPEVYDFIVGMRYATPLPAGVVKSKLRLYRDIGGYLCAVYGSYEEDGTVWAQVGKNDLGYPFLVLADTMRPRIIPQTYSDTVDSGAAQVITRFTIKENAGNPWYEFMYGPGNKGYVYVRNDTVKAGQDTITGVVNNVVNVMVSSSFGLRARLIIHDGVASDTEDVSRQVRSARGDAYGVNRMQWTPLRTTMSLDNKGSIESVFSRSTGGTAWTYDKTRQRIFRYFNPGVNDTNGWLEYSEADKEHFSFQPGRVVWLKSAQDMQVEFGGGVTQSLKGPYAIELKPNTWTDFSLPYHFPVMLRDILEATGVDISKKLEVYQWVWNDKQLIYDPVSRYIGPLNPDMTTVKDTVKTGQPDNAYLMYNHDTGVVSLLIPPVCLPLSKYAGGGQAVAASDTKERWVLSLLWSIPKETGDDHTVFMGYDPQLEVKSFYGPLPPVIGEGVTAGVVDTGRGALCGYGIHGSCEGGGVLYRVEFVNNSAGCRDLSFRIGGLEGLPRGYQVRILNEDKMAYEEQGAQEAHGLAVGAAGKAQRVVVVGSGDYFDLVLTELARWSLQFVKAYPNPFRGVLRLYYTLPAGIREVRFAVYDMRGKALWRQTEHQNTAKGAHVLLYDGNAGNSSGGYLSSGMYLIRMSAVDREGRVVHGGQRKVFRIR